MLSVFNLYKLHSYTNKMSLLLLNDDTEYLKVLDELFSGLFDNVSVAQLPSVAIRKLNEKEFDILITDNFMPEMYGVELIEKVRDGSIITNEPLRKKIIDIPILMMTGENSIKAGKEFSTFFISYVFII